MVTGVETAGLVLAAFPLVVKGLVAYADGCQKLTDMQHHSRLLQQFSVELDTEHAKFVNTCQNLLQHFVSPAELSELLKPGSEKWRSPTLQTSLESNLRKYSAQQFVLSVKCIDDSLQELRKMFPMAADEGKKSRKTAKKVIRSIGWVLLSDVRNDKMKQIRQLNLDLEKLSCQGQKTSGEVVTSKNKVIETVKFYRKVREHAIAFYNILQERLQPPCCLCRIPHEAGLLLQIRDKVEEFPKEPGILFKTFFSVQIAPANNMWRELDVQSEVKTDDTYPASHSAVDVKMEDSSIELSNRSLIEQLIVSGQQEARLRKRAGFAPEPPKSSSSRQNHGCGSRTLVNTEQPSSTSPVTRLRLGASKHQVENNPITNFCNILIDTPKLEGSCYGHLVDQGNTRHRIFGPTKALHPPRGQIVTLQDLFQTKFQFTTRQRLDLSVKLASSVIQLHSSGWLAEYWGRKDVQFFKTDEGFVIDSPIVCWGKHDIDVSGVKSDKSVVQCDQSLLSLGIVLIELHYGRFLENCVELSVQNKGKQAEENINQHDVAWNLVDSLYDDAGSLYSDAVRRCIRGIDHRESSLEKQGFKQEVFRMILGPLETNLQRFLGND
ncbi:hypothetical protein EDC01DRAFT_40144 [Geopyxis carbonaria]|nr:hypothetical protein EDC01DRAFT_40144 [Geopyxis carbonaria]